MRRMILVLAAAALVAVMVVASAAPAMARGDNNGGDGHKDGGGGHRDGSSGKNGGGHKGGDFNRGADNNFFLVSDGDWGDWDLDGGNWHWGGDDDIDFDGDEVSLLSPVIGFNTFDNSGCWEWSWVFERWEWDEDCD